MNARHPGYAGFVLTTLGVAVGYSSLSGLLAMPLLLLPGLAYRRRTKRLLPGVW